MLMSLHGEHVTVNSSQMLP